MLCMCSGLGFWIGGLIFYLIASKSSCFIGGLPNKCLEKNFFVFLLGGGGGMGSLLHAGVVCGVEKEGWGKCWLYPNFREFTLHLTPVLLLCARVSLISPIQYINRISLQYCAWGWVGICQGVGDMGMLRDWLWCMKTFNPFRCVLLGSSFLLSLVLSSLKPLGASAGKMGSLLTSVSLGLSSRSRLFQPVKSGVLSYFPKEKISIYWHSLLCFLCICGFKFLKHV